MPPARTPLFKPSQVSFHPDGLPQNTLPKELYPYFDAREELVAANGLLLRETVSLFTHHSAVSYYDGFMQLTWAYKAVYAVHGKLSTGQASHQQSVILCKDAKIAVRISRLSKRSRSSLMTCPCWPGQSWL